MEMPMNSSQRLRELMTPQPPGRLVACWRVLFGLSLAWFSLMLWPHLDELFTNHGLQINNKLSFGSIGSMTTIRLLWSGVIATSLCIASGFLVAPAAAACWLLLMLSWNANVLSRSPEMPLVHLSLLLLAICPLRTTRAPLATGSAGIAPIARAVAWAAFAVVYATAGLTKLAYEDSSWVDGSALYHVLNESTFRRLWYGDFFAQPSWFLQCGTWASLLLELLALPLVLFHRGRCVVLLISFSMHAIASLFLNLAEVSVHLLVFHLLLIDQRMIAEFQHSRQHARAVLRKVAQWFQRPRRRP